MPTAASWRSALAQTGGLGDPWTTATPTGSRTRHCRDAHTARAVLTAAEAGARSIEHGVFLDDESAAAMRENGCWYVPTLAPIRQLGDEAAIAAHRRSVGLALTAGVPVAAGSDLAVRPHVDLLLDGPRLAVDDLAGRIRAVWHNGIRVRD